MKIDKTKAYIFRMPPETVMTSMQQDDMRISMEKQRIARQFPWKRKGYRKHVK